MTGITAIRVDDEKNVVDNLTNRLDADLPNSRRASCLSSVGPKKMQAAPKPRSLSVRRLLASSHSKIIAECTL